MTGINEKIMKDVIQFMDSNDNFQDRIKSFPELERVCKKSKKFKSMLESLLSSTIKGFAKDNFQFFNNHYYEYIDGSANENFQIMVNGTNQTRGMGYIQATFKNDPFFSRLKEIYSYVDLVSLKKAYDIVVLEHIVKSMRENNRFYRLCPACQGDREATHLDHFLPRKFYPHLSLLNHNLVPLCSECNSKGAKGEKIPQFPNLHPYRVIPIKKLNFKFIGKGRACDLVFDSSNAAISNYVSLFQLGRRFKEKYFIEIMNEEIDLMIHKIAKEIERDEVSLTWFVKDQTNPLRRLEYLIVRGYIPWYVCERKRDMDIKIESYRNYRLSLLNSINFEQTSHTEIERIAKKVLNGITEAKKKSVNA